MREGHHKTIPVADTRKGHDPATVPQSKKSFQQRVHREPPKRAKVVVNATVIGAQKKGHGAEAHGLWKNVS
ncbi:MAG: hypothetical protein HQM00_14785 [Magnetococcales bacterium]|nr:hypothetical protein [Magnetococcales bacterium]